MKLADFPCRHEDHVVERLDTAKGLTPLRAAIEAAEAARWEYGSHAALMVKLVVLHSPNLIVCYMDVKRYVIGCYCMLLYVIVIL